MPLSDSEFNATLLLDVDYFDSVNLSNSDIAYDERQNLVFVTYGNDSDVNNENAPHRKKNKRRPYKRPNKVKTDE